ncbi:MAG TPA: PadR family transcriptional regulator [Bellilinea sp.]
MTPTEPQPLTPAVFHILFALADGEKHGYRIMQAVKINSRGEFTIGPGTLYGSIKRMLADDLIAESEERPDPELDDQRRHYYRLTDTGRNTLQADLARMDALLQRARALQILPASPTRGTP